MNGIEVFVCSGVSRGLMVRLERTRRGWRQVDLAAAAGVTQAEVSAYERGLRVSPAVELRIHRTMGLATDGS